jgi:arylsulfatase A-like enzyme
MAQLDDDIGYVLKKLDEMGQSDNTVVVFTTTTAPRRSAFPTAA